MSSKKLSVRIISVIISLTFLLTNINPSYAFSVLRPNLMGDKANKDRLDSVGKLASGQAISTAAQKDKFSFLQDYRPGWTFKGWRKAVKAIEERFTASNERKEALQLVLTLVRKLAKNKDDVTSAVLFIISYTEGIPELCKTVRDIAEFKLFMNLGIKLAENGIHPVDTFQIGIPEVVKVAKNAEELKLFISKGMKLAENKIDPDYTFFYDIPSIVLLTCTVEELNGVCDDVIKLRVKLAEYEPSYKSSTRVISDLTKQANNIDELKLFIDIAIELAENKIDSRSVLFFRAPLLIKAAKDKEERKLIINLAKKLEDNGIDPSQLLQYTIPAIIKLTKDIDELRDACDYLFTLGMKTNFFVGTGEVLYTFIPRVSRVAKNLNELKNICNHIHATIINLSENKIGHPAKYTILAIAVVLEKAKNIYEIRDACDYVIPKFVKFICETEKKYILVMKLMRKGHIWKGMKFQKRYGDFSLTYLYVPPSGERYQFQVVDNVPNDSPDFEIWEHPEKHKIQIRPLTNLSNLKKIPVLFLDTEVTSNPHNFKDALSRLNTNEGNISIVLLTQETKESIIANLRGIDINQVQFRTHTELGLQGLKWNEDERISLIDGIDKLKCIPLTQALCDAYLAFKNVRENIPNSNKTLAQVRDQV